MILKTDDAAWCTDGGEKLAVECVYHNRRTRRSVICSRTTDDSNNLCSRVDALFNTAPIQTDKRVDTHCFDIAKFHYTGPT